MVYTNENRIKFCAKSATFPCFTRLYQLFWQVPIVKKLFCEKAVILV